MEKHCNNSQCFKEKKGKTNHVGNTVAMQSVL
jgi:hypothetical protein